MDVTKYCLIFMSVPSDDLDASHVDDQNCWGETPQEFVARLNGVVFHVALFDNLNVI